MSRIKRLIKRLMKLALRPGKPLLHRFEQRLSERVAGELRPALDAVFQKMSTIENQHLAAMGEINIVVENFARELIRLQMHIEALSECPPDGNETEDDDALRSGAAMGPPFASPLGRRRTA